MILNLFNSKQMSTLALPEKVKGQYWLQDVDADGSPRDLICVEAVDSQWVLKSNKLISIYDGDEPVNKAVIKTGDFINLKGSDPNERIILYVEDTDDTRKTFRKVLVKNDVSFSIGRLSDNDFCYQNEYVSGKHATLRYSNKKWSITDNSSTNGTFVNGYKITSCDLKPGDMIYILGLKIVIGNNYLSLNDPDHALKIKSEELLAYSPQPVTKAEKESAVINKQYFYRSPRFVRKIEPAEISIDAPPAPERAETVPVSLMMGPSITMGMASLASGIVTVNNVFNNGGDISQALPTIIMAVSMLLGTFLWPILTKRFEKNQQIKTETLRRNKYNEYLEKVRDQIRAACSQQSEILNETYVSPKQCEDMIINRSSLLWSRMADQDDFLDVRVGTGTVEMLGEVKCPEKRFSLEEDGLQNAMLALGNEPKLVNNVPISVSLLRHNSLGICGPLKSREEAAKNILLQIMALHSYDEVKLCLISESEEWNYVRFIPHFWSDDKTERYVAENEEEVRQLSSSIEASIAAREENGGERNSRFLPHYVILSTSPRLYKKCSALQKILESHNNYGFSVIVLSDEMAELPIETQMIVDLNNGSARLYDRSNTTGNSVLFDPDNISNINFEKVAEALANTELDKRSSSYVLPTSVSFLEMFNVGKIEHLNSLTRWKENNPAISLQTPVGIDANGDLFNLDLHEKFHGPHGLVAGMTGSGKSEFILTYILSLAVNYHPDEVAFILIDYKGGGLAGAFEDKIRGIKLPHLAGTITNLDGAMINRSLISIQSELRRRQAIFNRARAISNEGTMDIYKYQKLYREKVVSEPVPHLFIISDEFAELKAQQPEFMEQLISAARIGRSLGVHLILATQKPSGVVDDQIWSNTKFRVCLKVQDKSDSQEVIKRPDAAELTQTGRFYLQVGYNELFMLGQSAYSGADYIPTDGVEKDTASSISVIDDLGRVVSTVKMGKKRADNQFRTKQIVEIVRYLSALAEEEHIQERQLWQEPIPGDIYVNELEEKYRYTRKQFQLNPVIGEYDDPFNQKQDLLTLPISRDGNCMVYGATGSGKTTFLTTLAYSLIRNHSPEEVNIYALDFASETLRLFEDAPQFGGVIVGAESEKLANFFKMLKQEMDNRRSLFSQFGGDYSSYIKLSGKTLPNIVVLLNNYSGFTEQYDEYQEDFFLLSRDGIRFGIYFIVTAGNTGVMRYRTQQNFSTMVALQLNDATDYYSIVGKTDGLVPTKTPGRGLVKLDKAYEFQTAQPARCDDQNEYIRKVCAQLSQRLASRARQIPVLPKTLTAEDFLGSSYTLANLPIGIEKKNLGVSTINLENKVVYGVFSQEVGDSVSFVEELFKLLQPVTLPVLIDADEMVDVFEGNTVEKGKYEEFVVDLYNEMVNRNNTYKDSGLDNAVLDEYRDFTYVFVGIRNFMSRLSDDRLDKLRVLIEKAESIYKIHFIIVDTVSQVSLYSNEAWFKKHFTGTEGIWVGDGITDQYVIKLSKTTPDLYEELPNGFGYRVYRNKPVLTRLVSSDKQEEE